MIMLAPTRPSTLLCPYAPAFYVKVRSPASAGPLCKVDGFAGLGYRLPEKFQGVVRHLFGRNAGDHRRGVSAGVIQEASAADRAVQAPGESRAVSGARQGGGVYKVRTPVDTDGRRPDSHCQMQRPGVVGDDDLGQSIPHGGELLRRPPAPGISSAGMQGDQSAFIFLDRASGLSEIPVRHREAWLQVRRTCADQAHNLQIPEYLRLVVDVGHVAVKGYCLWGFHARRDPCPEPANKRVGVAPAAVHLERQVEPLLPHAREEALQFLLVLVHARIGAVDPRGGWDGDRTLDRLGPSGEKLGLKGATEQRDLRSRISLPERPERR